MDLGSFSQQFIGAVESTRNKPKSYAIAYSKSGPNRIRWGNSYGKASQELANKEALETCEKNRPASDEPCKLFDLDANVAYSVAKTPGDKPMAKPAPITEAATIIACSTVKSSFYYINLE